MKSILAWLVITCVPLALIAAFAPAPDADVKKVEYKVHANYFENRENGLHGSTSYLAITERESFDRTFGVGLVRGQMTQVLPRDAFETRFVAAVIKRGTSIWEYKVEKLTADGDTLAVRYQATEHTGGVAETGRPSSDSRKGFGDSSKAPDTAPATRKATAETIRIEPRGTAFAETKKEITTEARGGGTYRVIGTARNDGETVLSSPLVISFPKGKYAAIVFIENGRKVGMARLEN